MFLQQKKKKKERKKAVPEIWVMMWKMDRTVHWRNRPPGRKDDDSHDRRFKQNMTRMTAFFTFYVQRNF